MAPYIYFHQRNWFTEISDAPLGLYFVRALTGGSALLHRRLKSPALSGLNNVNTILSF